MMTLCIRRATIVRGGSGSVKLPSFSLAAQHGSYACTKHCLMKKRFAAAGAVPRVGTRRTAVLNPGDLFIGSAVAESLDPSGLRPLAQPGSIVRRAFR
jgi:hypothetical protein